MPKNPVLYWNVISQPSRAVKAMLDIAKIQYKLVNIDLFKLEQKKPTYLSINPMGTVPTLEHQGLKITQSIAILVYICEKYDSVPKSYYGKNAEQRSQVNQYLSWCQSYLRPNLGALFFIQKQTGLRKRKPLLLNQIQAAELKMTEALELLDKIIGDKDYLANNTPTIADIMIYFQVTILVYHSKDHQKYQNIKRWFKNIYSIPQVKMVTHQWFAIAQQFAKMLQQIPVKNASL